MKFSTVLGASFSRRRMTILPCDVSKMAYVPAGLAMESPLLDQWECYRYFRRQSKRGRLPAFLGSEFGDVGGVMIAMPGIEEEHPVEGADAVIGMAESAGEFIGSNGAQQANPTLVKRVEQIEREFGGSVLGVFEFGSGGFVVWLD